MRPMTLVLALIALLTVNGQTAITAYDTSESAPSSSPKAKPIKPHHRRSKRTTHDSPAIKKSVDQAGGTTPRAGVADVKPNPGGSIDFMKGNDAGQQNKGSQDHTPGTTGTSGQ